MTNDKPPAGVAMTAGRLEQIRALFSEQEFRLRSPLIDAVRELLTELDRRSLTAVEAERQAARNDALEEAAKIADGWSVATNYLPENVSANSLAAWLTERDFKMGGAIRALSLPQAKETR